MGLEVNVHLTGDNCDPGENLLKAAGDWRYAELRLPAGRPPDTRSRCDRCGLGYRRDIACGRGRSDEDHKGFCHPFSSRSYWWKPFWLLYSRHTGTACAL